MDRDLALVQFISATDADPDVARQYLEASIPGVGFDYVHTGG